MACVFVSTVNFGSCRGMYMLICYIKIVTVTEYSMMSLGYNSMARP